MTPRIITTALTLTGLAACAAPPPPAVTSFNGHSVELLTVAAQPNPTAETNGEAARICSKSGMYAEHASSREIKSGHKHFYLCLSPEPLISQGHAPAQPMHPATSTIVIR